MTRDDDLLSSVLQEIDNAEYTSLDDLQLAMDYYNATLRGDEVEGRSIVQSHDVADMIEALTAQIMPSFQVNDLVEFDPVSPQDEDQARLEGKIVNHVFMQLNNGFVTLQEGLKNTLLMRNAIFKVFADRKITVRQIGSASVHDNFDFMLMNESLQPNQTLSIDEETDAIIVTTTHVNLKVESVPPEEFLYLKGWNQQSLKECPFVAHHREIKRHELIDMGFSPAIVDELPVSTSDDTFGTDIRDRKDDNVNYSSNRMLDSIEYYEVYYTYDYNDDGYPELLKVCIASERLLQVEEVDYHPFAGGTAIIMPNRFRGVSTFDQQKDVQDGKTKVLRQYADNINSNNNRRLEVEIKNIIEPNDLTDSRPGGIIRSRRIGSVAPIPVDDIGPSCEQFLGYWDRIRTNRSGASLDMASENLPINNETAHGAERVISSKEQIGNLAANTFKETVVKDMFSLIHKTLKDDFQNEMSYKVSGKWINTNPAQWLERINIRVTIGESQGLQQKKIMSLAAVLDQQLKAVANGQGDILVNQSTVYEALVDFGAASGLTNPEKYWINPQSEQGKQAMQNSLQAAQKNAQMQQQLQNAMLSNETLRTESEAKSKQSKAVIDAMRLQLEELKAAAKESLDNQQNALEMQKHYDNMAMQLTSLEAQYSQQITDYDQNKQEVTGG